MNFAASCIEFCSSNLSVYCMTFDCSLTSLERMTYSTVSNLLAGKHKHNSFGSFLYFGSSTWEWRFDCSLTTGHSKGMTYPNLLSGSALFHISFTVVVICIFCSRIVWRCIQYSMLHWDSFETMTVSNLLKGITRSLNKICSHDSWFFFSPKRKSFSSSRFPLLVLQKNPTGYFSPSKPSNQWCHLLLTSLLLYSNSCSLQLENKVIKLWARTKKVYFGIHTSTHLAREKTSATLDICRFQ